MKRILTLMFMTFAILSVTSIPSSAGEPFTVINTQQLKTMMDEKETTTIVIDSRSKPEYDQAHIQGAISLPLSQMTSNPSLLGSPDLSKRVFYCSGAT